MEQYIKKSDLVAELKKRFDYRVNGLKAINNGTFWKEEQSEDEFNAVLTRCAYNAAKNEVFELMCFLDTLEMKEVDEELQGIQKEVAEGYVARINRKRIPIELKGEIKAKFKNEFHTIWQTVNEMQFANVAKYIIERICLHFATWGAYHLKDYIGMSDEEKAKMDSLQEEPKPKFNVGQTITDPTDSTFTFHINKIEDGRYIEKEDEWVLVKEADANYELVEEPVSEDLEEAAFDYAEACKYEGGEKLLCVEHFKAGANWQKNHLWKPADGDDLPIIDREVIALLDNGKVVFAHRPPEYWDGKNIITGKVTRNYPKTYDKGGWNIPNIKYWLDVELPKEIEL